MEKQFYNYIYTNPTAPGKFQYADLPMSFMYEPFYVGKGFGRRWKSDGGRNKWLKHKIAKIGLPIAELVCIFNIGISETDVLSEEKRWIATIGRRDLDKGPLLNLTDGGETTVGMIPWNKGKPGKPWSIETREKMKHRVPWNKGKKGVQTFSPETREKMKHRVPWNKGKSGGIQSTESNTKRSITMRNSRRNKFWSTRKIKNNEESH